MLDETLDRICLKRENQKIIVMTVGNIGYLQLLKNWWLSIDKNTDMSVNSLILSYDEPLVEKIKQLLPLCNVCHISYKASSEAIQFKQQGWDEVTLFKLYAIHLLIQRGYTVYYIDPDVYVIKNSIPNLISLMSGCTKMLIQQGKPYCSGVIFAPPNEVTNKLFDPIEWSQCKTDDEHYIIDFFGCKYKHLSQHVRILDLERYPNGLVWKMGYTPEKVADLIDKGVLELLHFNYIAGIENKIQRMKMYGMWNKIMRIIDVPHIFTPDINQVILDKKRNKYPPHQEGDQIESYTHKYMANYLKTHIIHSEYDYLPICWTALSLKNCTDLTQSLCKWLFEFRKNNPDTKCWTVVQHCKGIELSMGIVLPDDWLIFSTSDPNACYEFKKVQCIAPLSEKEKIVLLKNIPRVVNTGVRNSAESAKKLYLRNKRILQELKSFNQFQETLSRGSISVKNKVYIPLLSSVHPSSNKKTWTANRKYLASFMGDLTISDVRTNMQKYCKGPGVVIQSGNCDNNADTHKFEELMLNSTFALCPRGFGNTSFRLVEAMQFGAIPVYISDVFTLPYSDVLDWNKFCVIVKHDEIENLYQRLSSITLSQIQDYRENIQKVYDSYFTMDGCCSYLVRYFNKK